MGRVGRIKGHACYAGGAVEKGNGCEDVVGSGL